LRTTAAVADYCNMGFDLPPSGYEGWFLSTALAQANIERTLDAAREAAKEMGASGIPAQRRPVS